MSFPTYAGENGVKQKSGSHRLDELVAYHLLVTPAEKYKQKLLSATLHILVTLLVIQSGLILPNTDPWRFVCC